ncbi:ABC transporter permease, partial [Arsukibacterium sp.]|uniref:ABC transporter permease n=1 Tax=Arsukibacterium sp. TaxID=1977258 RepID=UPI00299E3825
MSTTADAKTTADLVIDPERKARLLARGEWTLPHVQLLNEKIDTLAADASQLDASGISRLDASGAMLLDKLCAQTGQQVTDAGLAKQWHTLFEAVTAVSGQQLPVVDAPPVWYRLLAGLGRHIVGFGRQSVLIINFLGIIVQRLAGIVRQPGRLRLTATVWHMQQTGLNAAPLLILLASLTGAVVAYLGATVLRDFGAEVFIIDLVTFAFLRE